MSEELPVNITTDEVQANPHRTGLVWKDNIFSGTAIFLAVISLFVGIGNARTQRELVSASTWPFVTAYMKNSVDGEGSTVFGLVNSGGGPAKIVSFEVYYKDHPVLSPLDLLRRCCDLPKERQSLREAVEGWVFATTSNAIVLRAGEDQSVMTVRPNPEYPEVAEKFSRVAGELDYRACYCSVLDECWESDLSSRWGSNTRKVGGCKPAAHPFTP